MYQLILSFILILSLSSCKKSDNSNTNNPDETKVFYKPSQFVMGADLSYVNQILDHGGDYKDSGNVADPYQIFQKYGANVIRLRLFYNPTWTKDVYGTSGTQMYNDYADVKKSIGKVKAAGMQACLDFHYSDTWADPSHQIKPAAWDTLTRILVLADSVYNYTFRTLSNLGNNGLMPRSGMR
jgi:arabinogalactan endo-1,4-beta-galactosidase